MTPPRPCMGGFCAERLACENYSDPYTPGPIDHRTPSENLCNEIIKLERLKKEETEEHDNV
jgi:hypothetical protein